MTGPGQEGRLPVGILGATGLVGQQLVSHLTGHPWFRVTRLMGSERSQGEAYGRACAWGLGHPMPNWAAGMTVEAPEPVPALPIVFSAVDAAAAVDWEPAWARAGSWVFTNASAFRMAEDVPLMIAEVNPEHLELTSVQRRVRGWEGAIVANPNCSSTFLTMALAPLHREFGVTHVLATTLQAASGAGTRGVSALELLGNVLPHIEGEEEKIETEPKKILGSMMGDRIQPAAFKASAAANRVPVADGHLARVAVGLGGSPSLSDVAAALGSFRQGHGRRLPSSPGRCIHVRPEPDRPQPRLDLGVDRDMSVTVGRLKRCPVLSVSFAVLGHNTVRGAGPGSVLNAELAFVRGAFS